MIADPDLVPRLEATAAFLKGHRSLWEHAPFKMKQMPWEVDHPELATAVREMTDARLRELEQYPSRARRYLARWLPQIADFSARSELRALSRRDVAFDGAQSEGVRHRKWLQIEAFVSSLPEIRWPVLEWCSGKGHLARVIAATHGVSVHCVERDAQLAHGGRQAAERDDLSLDFSVLDAMGREAAHQVRQDQMACALHACGDLHIRLMSLAVRAQTRALAISPCCYHLGRFAGRPISRTARGLDLALRPEDARISLQETVTASPGAKRRREQINAWRLGFDLWQRESRGKDEYLPVPPVKDDRAKSSFADFFRWACAAKGLEIPRSVDFDQFERAGEERLQQTRRFSLVRHLFRRPMELWLVLDRAQALAERDYQVEVGTFCDREVTPRNLMIRAVA